jgi:hypothetical protein
MTDEADAMGVETAAKSLRVRLTALFAGAAGLLLLLLIIVQWQLAGGGADARRVGLAQNQVTLVARMARAGQNLTGIGTAELRRAAQEELRDSLARFERQHNALQRGDGRDLPALTSARLGQMYADLEQPYQAIAAAVTRILAAPDSQGELYQAVQRLTANEAAFAGGMEAIRLEYEEHAASRLATARWLSALLGLLILLGAAAFLIRLVVPADKRLQLELDHQSERREDAERLFAAAPTALLLVDAASLSLTAASSHALRLLGCAADDVAGRPLSSHFDTALEANRRFLDRVRSGEGFDDHPVLIVDVRSNGQDARASLRPLTHAGRKHHLIALAAREAPRAVPA